MRVEGESNPAKNGLFYLYTDRNGNVVSELRYIQPSLLAKAVGSVLGPDKVSEQNEWTVEEMYDALIESKIVIVDILVGSGKQDDPTLQEFPTTQSPNYAHFARVLGIDPVGNTIYLENTLALQSGEYWEVSKASFQQIWESPEVNATSGPKEEDREPVTRWAMTIDPSAYASR